MSDSITFDVAQGVKSKAGTWYKCVQPLGTGGNAVVYLVVATEGRHKGVLFALKVFRKLSKPDRRESFLKEIDFLLQCEHPAVMRVYDSGRFVQGSGSAREEYPFVVAEYLPNTLETVMRAGSASLVEKLAYATQLLSALQYLSSLAPQVVHRDIKPRNIFVKGRACVLGDFGLMKLLNDNAESGRILFKESVGAGIPFSYRTPDLVRYAKGEAGVTTKSDIFQLGLVLAELFTGQVPVRPPKSMMEPVHVLPLAAIPGKHGPGIGNRLQKMLEPNPEKRKAAKYIMDSWQGAFEQAVLTAHELEGRAF